MRHLLYITLLLALILSACGPGGSASPEPAIPSPDGSSVETPTQVIKYPPAALAARDLLAGQLGVTADEIEIDSVELVEWPDSCLGVFEFGELCADVITPGYRVILKHLETAYEFHTDLDGASIRQLEQRPTSAYPVGVQAALQHFSTLMRIPQDGLKVTFEPRQFPDSCLGLEMPGQICAQVITPGFVVNISMKSSFGWEYYVNETGSSIHLADGPDYRVADAVITWQDPSCGQLYFQNKTITFAPCGESLLAIPFPDNTYQPTVFAFQDTFQPFEADTPAGKVIFKGRGASVATPAEQRMMAEWARSTLEILQPGRAGAAWGLALTWHREGGIAGFCDEVSVYLAGYAQVSNCGGMNDTLRLTATQLEQLYGWVDGYSPIDFSHTDPATADAMTTTLIVTGLGSQAAEAQTINEASEFAASLVVQAQAASQAGTDEAAAAAALLQFFQALNRGDYITGAKLYGGDTQILQDWNPDIQNDLPAWLERACSQNGLVCLLPRSLTYMGQDAGGNLQFAAEFNNPDGSLFRQGPCCGEEIGPVFTSFTVRVKKHDDLWLTLDLPPYVP